MPNFNFFQNMIRLGGNIGFAVSQGSREAIKWFRSQVGQIKKTDPNEVLDKNPERMLRQRRIGPRTIGKMVMYWYDPKWKHKLPYYDRFPLLLPIPHAKGGKYFMGLNLHYLSPYQRAKLFDALMEYSQGKDEKRKLQLTYGLLKSTTKLAAYKPCLKLYLYSHVRSNFYVVPPSEWHLMLMLPTARFERGGKGRGGKFGGYVGNWEVYRDSRRKFS